MEQQNQSISRLFFVILLVLGASICCGAQRPKMSSSVRQIMLRNENAMRAKGNAAQQGTQRRMMAFVRTTDKAVLRQNDCRVMAEFGNICITNIPVNRLRSLAASDAVLRIEAGRRNKPLLDSAVIMTNAHRLWTEASTMPSVPSSLKGTGVVVGVMDIGFDLTSPMYYSEDGSRYRVKALWDQLDLTGGGAPVTGTDTTYIGRQYVGKEQLLALGHTYDGYAMTHGTFTSTTAAGNGLAFVPQAHEALRQSLPYGVDSQLFSGIAPDADICLVCNAAGDNIDSIPEKNYDYYNTALDALGFKYIFDYADAHGQPCVVSFSEGSYPYFDDEDVLYAEVISQMLGSGHILCVAAGNESHHNTYMKKPYGVPQVEALIYSGFSPVFNIRSSGDATYRLTFRPKDGEAVVREYTTQQTRYDEQSGTVFADTVIVSGRSHIVMMATYPSYYDERDIATELVIEAEDGGLVSSDIRVSLALLGESVQTEVFTAGGYFSHDYSGQIPDAFDNTHCVLSPGSFPRVICVGSVNTRNCFMRYNDRMEYVDWGAKGRHSGFSSIGPSPTGNIKPDVSAPGSMVMGLYSSFYHEKNISSWDSKSFEWNGRVYPLHADCGTSMSCPVVAGIVALWLQVCPTLTPEQVMEVIAATSQRPEDFSDYDCVTDENGFLHNNVYGYGIIDAYAGLQYVRSHFTGIDELAAPSASAVAYDVMGRRLASPQRGQLYIVNGKKYIGK